MWQPMTVASSLSIFALTLLGTFSSSYNRHFFTALLTTVLITQRNSPSFAWTASLGPNLWRLYGSEHTPTIVIRNAQSGPSSSPPLIHFIFLVHGYKGMSADLSYLQHNLRSCIEQRAFCSSNNNSQPCKVVIHNAISNELRTKDGVEQGGDRLFQEILHVIRTHVQQEHINNNTHLRHDATHSTTHVTLSMIGNSLGGIYRCVFATFNYSKLSCRHYSIIPNLFPFFAHSQSVDMP